MPALLVPLLRSSICFYLRVYPGFHIGLRPHFTLGYAGVPPFQGSLSDWLCAPRVPYRALPSFHPGLCRSVALAGLFVRFCLRLPRVSYRALPSFHPGLCGSVALAGLIVRFCLRLPRVSYRALPSFHPGLCRSVALAGLILFCLLFTQGFISGFALIPPWALRECRPLQGSIRFCLRLPRVSYRALPSFHPGLCRSAALTGLFARFCCFPRVSYRALPSFHPGLCRSAALAGLNDVFINHLLLLMCLSDTGRDKSMG